jgi:hypothetical protein
MLASPRDLSIKLYRVRGYITGRLEVGIVGFWSNSAKASRTCPALERFPLEWYYSTFISLLKILGSPLLYSFHLTRSHYMRSVLEHIDWKVLRGKLIRAEPRFSSDDSSVFYTLHGRPTRLLRQQTAWVLWPWSDD